MSKLGIYIPTYNRKEELKACLESFIPQLKLYNFPIFVSDNNSTDGTEKMIKEMKRIYPNIFYKKNKSRLGNTYASNVINVLGMGDTEFVWLFGDDDLIEEEAIDTIIDNLKGNEFLQINSSIWSRDFSRMFQERKIHLHKDLEYSPGEHGKVLANATHGYAGFMSEIITKSQYVKRELRRLNRKGIGKREFIHVTLFYRSIIGKKGRLIADPLIRNRTQLKFGGREIETWMVSFPQTLNELKRWYQQATLAKVGSLPTYSFIGIVCINKIQHPEKTREFLGYVKKDEFLSGGQKALLTTLLNLPTPILRAMIYPTAKINGFRIVT